MAIIKAVPIVVSYSTSLVPNINTLPLKRMPCINYSVQFWKDQAKV